MFSKILEPLHNLLLRAYRAAAMHANEGTRRRLAANNQQAVCKWEHTGKRLSVRFWSKRKSSNDSAVICVVTSFHVED